LSNARLFCRKINAEKEKEEEEAEDFSYGFRKMTVKKEKGAENKEVHECESAFVFILQGIEQKKKRESCCCSP
jgi:hypothetical protein